MSTSSKILIIDSSESTRTFMRYILTNAGHRVSVSANGAKALETLKDETFDIFLIDLRLSDMDGFDLVKEIRSILAFKTKPILAVNQLYSDLVIEQGEKAGVTHWVTQPVSPYKLLTLIKDLTYKILHDEDDNNNDNGD